MGWQDSNGFDSRRRFGRRAGGASPSEPDDGFEQMSPAPAEQSSQVAKADGPNASGPALAVPKHSGPSLKMLAVGFLSRREHSRVELARKLAAHVDPANPQELEDVLNELERENWLSNTRFAQSLVHRRASRKGAALVVQELRQHGLPDEHIAEIRSQLQETELDRAREVWQRKFNRAPADRADYARQFRFLASRGFSPDCLRRILGELDDSQ
jgi:regulatory protein